MCIVTKKAEINDVITASWQISDTHVIIGYQTTPQNLAKRENCMILHIDSLEDLIPENIIDTSQTPDLLNNLYHQVKEKTRSTKSKSINHVMDMGPYQIFIINDIESANDTLNIMDKDSLEQDITSLFGTVYAGYKLLFCYFDNKSPMKASPIMVKYRPFSMNYSHLPGLEGHGEVPIVGKTMQKYNQRIIIGKMNDHDGELKKVNKIHSIFPNYALSADLTKVFRHKYPAGDIIIDWTKKVPFLNQGKTLHDFVHILDYKNSGLTYEDLKK